jgi:hypothetical protein
LEFAALRFMIQDHQVVKQKVVKLDNIRDFSLAEIVSLGSFHQHMEFQLAKVAKVLVALAILLGLLFVILVQLEKSVLERHVLCVLLVDTLINMKVIVLALLVLKVSFRTLQNPHPALTVPLVSFKTKSLLQNVRIVFQEGLHSTADRSFAHNVLLVGIRAYQDLLLVLTVSLVQYLII